MRKHTFAAKKSRINIRNRVCYLKGYPRKGFDKNLRIYNTEMQIRRNIHQGLSKVIYLTLMQRVEWWESGLGDWMTSLSELHCYKVIPPPEARQLFSWLTADAGWRLNSAED